MGKRDDLIVKYVADLKDKCDIEADLDLLTKITIGCGPSIYNKDSATVSATSAKEMETVKKNFLIKKLGLSDGPKLDSGIESVVDQYGKSVRAKHRPVFYYLLVKHFGKESVYS